MGKNGVEALDPTVAGVPLSDLAAVNEVAPGPRSKRSAILDTAVTKFGADGFEATKWSTIADEVGIGQTALYHYFESKAHCLLTIIRLELAQSYQRFCKASQGRRSRLEELEAVLESVFDVSQKAIIQTRIVMANTDVLAAPRNSEREETERLACLELTREIENAWVQLFRLHYEETGSGQDPVLTARAVLGLFNSLWRWYRPGGPMSLTNVSGFYRAAARRIID
ncbi:TetR/AcrR family transcriptional regulator [Arthrobacter bambusae]|uniref:TetR/AcrR family transcriptional regulator n=1 Tax=Arthrobacter bambusae TaxID=1338426 RepID=UPI002789E41B|nr:TetR/AcrR family transcriptional regulator [Arthrobacter bambusae]MDQ0242118.1 AcrR family transcriptional regulator [Arthrobacter bambusae]